MHHQRWLLILIQWCFNSWVCLKWLDIKRSIHSLYTKGNTIIKHFRKCTDDVKVKLSNHIALHFMAALSGPLTLYYNACKNKLVVAYKQIFRNLMNVQREGTTMNMLKFNVDHLDVVLRKLIFGFRNRLLLCDNNIVQAIICCFHFTLHLHLKPGTMFYFAAR